MFSIKNGILKLSAVLLLVGLGFQYWPVVLRIQGAAPEEEIFIRMPFKDKKRLEYFFRDTCCLNAWAYTLLGSKPVSIHQYRKPSSLIQYFLFQADLKDIFLECCWPPNFRKICYFLNPEQVKIKWGWETLNKYFSRLHSSQFALCTYYGDEIVVLTVIDKVKLIRIVEEHQKDFRDVLTAQAIEPQELLDNKKLWYFIKSLNHDGLIGTVLGYGRDNAWLYRQYAGVDPNVRPLIPMWSDEEDRQLEAVNQKLLSFQPWDFSDLFYPTFMCDPESEETSELRKIYREEREKIIDYYAGKDIVEATLSLLNGHSER